VVGEDRGEVALIEPPGLRGRLQRLVDIAGPVQLGEIDGLGDLAPQPRGAGRRGSGQPAFGAGSDRKERLLLRALRAGPALPRSRLLLAGSALLLLASMFLPWYGVNSDSSSDTALTAYVDRGFNAWQVFAVNDGFLLASGVLALLLAAMSSRGWPRAAARWVRSSGRSF
jgi:hypothetical protein